MYNTVDVHTPVPADLVLVRDIRNSGWDSKVDVGGDDIRVGCGGIPPKWGSRDYPSWLDEDSIGGAYRVFEVRVGSGQVDSAFRKLWKQMLFCPCQKAAVSSVVVR